MPESLEAACVERVVASGHLAGETRFRLAVAGDYGLPEVEKLIQLLELMRSWYGQAARREPEPQFPDEGM